MQAQFSQQDDEKELLYFWALGDLHYFAQPDWDRTHTQRLGAMFEDLHALWEEMGQPAFCVSPGDIVETHAQENYALARARLEDALGPVPFYPGIGNHEYMGALPIPLGNGEFGYIPPPNEDPVQIVQTFTQTWGRPIRYLWQVGDNVTCIMLDYPNPFRAESPFRLYLEDETLAFLDTALAENRDRLAVIFLHCPLYNTVGDRDPEVHRDDHSLEHFCALEPESSAQVRAILARHENAGLFITGHTHTGWEAPGLVSTEQAGAHPVTFVNLMCPWYTGRNTGHYTGVYIADDPDVIPTFAIKVYADHASLSVRDHRTRQWLKTWVVPLKG